MPAYAVTGASGHLGRFAIEELLNREVAFRDLTPDRYTQALLSAGLDEPTARFVARLDASLALGGQVFP